MHTHLKLILAQLLLLITLLCTTESKGQKVGVVLSGGGASALAHIGFIRALEENDIPIDYISGTSMGALVGALYASGYSTEEMEAIFKSDAFRLWVEGKIDNRYTHYFKKIKEDASWIRLKVSPDSILETNLPTNIINTTSLDFGLSELFATASASSKDNFDSLFIPFRCNASDITSKKSVVFKNGNLSTAVRASISYPFYLNPVNVNGKLLYDGGLYDNFPVSSLCNEFEPDYIIGSNVSYNFPAPEEDNILSQIRSMMSTDTKYSIECEKGFIVEPKTAHYSLLDFENVEEVINVGYVATMEKIDSIKLFLPYRKNHEDVRIEREAYAKKKPNLEVKKVEITGLNKSESKYIMKSLRFKKGEKIQFDKIESKILRIASDEKIKRVDPDLIYVDSLEGFVLELNVKKEKNFVVSFGGNISTMAVNEGFVGLQYNYLNRTPITVYANTYFGRFYTSGYGLFNIEFPTAIPFQLNASYTYNKWDYFQNSTFIVEESNPSYLIDRENFAQVGITFPVKYKGKLGIAGNGGNIKYDYYQDNEFTRFDTADVTNFNNTSVFGYYERNSLNKKQYANQGNYVYLRASYTEGEESTTPGNSTPIDTNIKLDHSWFRVKARIDQYFSTSNKFKFGFMLEGVYSDQPFFSNYASTLLSSPAFEPIPESKTIFRSKFRAHQYGAVGLRTIFSPLKNLDMRLEGFMFQPIKETVINKDGNLDYEAAIQNRYFIGSFTLVYDLNVTQIAFNVNYYDNFNDQFPTNKPENYTFMFHLGYILFNQKMLD